MPPPPVAGAAVGTGLGVGLADGLAVGVAVGVVVGVIVGLAVGLTLALVVGVGEPDAPGEIGGGVAEGVDPEQAERAAEPMSTKAAQKTVNLALRPFPMMVVLRRGMGTWVGALTCDGLFFTGYKAT